MTLFRKTTLAVCLLLVCPLALAGCSSAKTYAKGNISETGFQSEYLKIKFTADSHTADEMETLLGAFQSLN